MRIGIARTTYVAYVLVLLALLSLGVFVTGLALGSGFAPVAGIAMLVFLGLSVLGFRAGGKKVDRASEGNDHELSIWVDPMRDSDIARYRATYRGAGQATTSQRATAVVGASDPAFDEEPDPAAGEEPQIGTGAVAGNADAPVLQRLSA